MKYKSIARVAALFVSVGASLGPFFGTLAAQASDDFYDGKSIKVTVRSASGNAYDAYARLLARHMGKYIPGKPNFIVINMDGAGGLLAANYLAHRASRDGTEFAALAGNVATAQRLGLNGVQYNIRELISLGNPAGEVFTLAVKKDFPVNNLTQLRAYKTPVTFSASGAGSGANQIMMAMQADGFPIKIIAGYPGSADKMMAVVRGEVDATGSSLDGLGNATGVESNGLKIIGHIGTLDHPILAGSETIVGAMSAKVRPLMEMLAAPVIAARPFFLPPGVPADRVLVLRTAFKTAMSDANLLDEAEKQKLDIAYVSPEEMDDLINKTMSAPDEIVSALK